MQRLLLIFALSPFGAHGLNTTASLCNGRPVVSPDSAWVWSTGAVPSPSCSNPPVINNAQMCEGDPTSIVLQASGQAECLASKMECPFSMHDLTQLDFDVDMVDCEGTWAAPLWMSPNHWEGGGYSGEIDMLENCPWDQVRSNFAGPSDNGKEVAWTGKVGTGNDFKAHTTLWKQDDGNGVQSIHVKACRQSEMNGDGTCPEDGAAYLWNIYQKNGCSKGDCMYHMISDIWNGQGGDGGWVGCTNAKTNWGSKCKFSITNIRTKGVQFQGKCAAMTGAPTPTPPPPPTPTPTPTPTPSPPTPSGSCSVGDAVACPNSAANEMCAGNQCCQDGSTCPSAESSFSSCPSSKAFDCTVSPAPSPTPPPPAPPAPSPEPSPTPPPPTPPAPTKGHCCWGGPGATCATASDCHADAYCSASEDNCLGSCSGMWCNGLVQTLETEVTNMTNSSTVTAPVLV